jgi:CheY-like chemotaxis protein
MVTSRTMAKHRDLARQAGVDVYLTKPYTDNDLLGAAQQLTSTGWLADEPTAVLKSAMPQPPEEVALSRQA